MRFIGKFSTAIVRFIGKSLIVIDLAASVKEDERGG
jgi:hypothetical protein